MNLNFKSLDELKDFICELDLVNEDFKEYWENRHKQTLENCKRILECKHEDYYFNIIITIDTISKLNNEEVNEKFQLRRCQGCDEVYVIKIE